ncbi:MAG: VWA domain-containing protein [Acidobacteriota bacterium]|nr:VWA domain-containing protein [Acidobacteriota bacterium]
MIAIRAVALAAVLIVALIAPAEPQPILWHSQPATALTVARAQQKMLLVYYRGACGPCNNRMDAMFVSGASDSVFTHAFDTYLPLRLTAGPGSPHHSMLDELAARKEVPLVAIYDASGAQLVVVNRKLPWSGIVEELLRVRAERARIVRSVQLRQAGQAPEADLVLGTALFNARQPLPATDRLQRAVAGFRAAGAEEQAQLAEIMEGGAWYLAQQKARGRKIVADVLRNAVSDAIAAEAHLAIARQYEAAALTTRRVPEPAPQANPRARTPAGVAAPIPSGGFARTAALTNRREMLAAIESYRKAYELAPEGSMAHELARYSLERLDDQPLPLRKTSSQSLLRIVTPARMTVLGDADFLIEGPGNIARVDYLLDDVKVASSAKHPFRVSIDVGRTPRARTVKAVAFDAAGNAKGEALATINDRMDAFFVSIVAPASATISGASDIELDVRIPPGRSVARVDVSWNGNEIASLTTAPFRARMNVAPREFGYLRAVATLDDGSSAEVTRIYNSGGVSETVEVGAVTVIASVANGKGERIGGLVSKDFAIADEGQAVIAELRSADEDPVTIGIAIDSSSSMSGMQVYVIRAATEFLGRALRPQDQAFVVAFDTGPRLVHPRSSDTVSLRESVYALAPRGGTSIFDGVTFALQQFQGIPGKKALLVFSDGREGTSSASAKECERMARTVGVPVYVIVPPRGSSGRSNALGGIAEDTGGTIFIAEPEGKFPALFERLAEEMRGQYVLSFTRPAGVKAGTWRSIRVTVERRDANVRTIQGYRAN